MLLVGAMVVFAEDDNTPGIAVTSIGGSVEADTVDADDDIEEDVVLSLDRPNIRVPVNCLRVCKNLGKRLYTETDVSGKKIRVISKDCLGVCRVKKLLNSNDVVRTVASKEIAVRKVTTANLRDRIVEKAKTNWQNLDESQKKRLKRYYEGVKEVDAYKLRKLQRSEERRVGKECRSRWSPYH